MITGHTGFKGSWLSLWLQQRGAEVTGYATEPPTDPSLFRAARVHAEMRSVIGDVRDLSHLFATVVECRPDLVIHLAAQPLVRYGYANPVETFATNVMGTVNLLEAVRQAGGVRVVLVITSDKCYENREWPWGYREIEPMGGRDPYSSSKGCAELVTAAYRESFFPAQDYARHGVALASARAGNVIGGGDWATDRLIPDIVRSFSEGQTVLIRNPHAIRPWQHVLDPLSGYLSLMERLWEGPAFSGGWNFGPDDGGARPVSAIVERMVQLWGQGARWEHDAGPHPHEAHFLKLDCSLARSRLGWTPRLPFDTALEWTIAWYRAYWSGQDARILTQEQIAAYEALGMVQSGRFALNNS
jgi:CDP-glucose 4,6-dehydratase